MTLTVRAAVLTVLILAMPLAARQEPAPKGDRIDHGKGDPALKGFTTPPGFKLELVATPPLAHPASVQFDTDGRLLVREAPPGPGEVKKAALPVAYKDGSTRKLDLRVRSGKDAVQALADARGDDAWGSVATFAHPDGLAAHLVHDGATYLAVPGQLLRRLDKAEAVLVRGFGDVPGGVTGLAVGPDRWLYVAVAAADHHLEGSDGSRVTLLGTGGVLRCRPDGSRLHVVARGLAHPTAPTWDSLGNAFLADHDGRTGRLLHLLDGSDHGFRRETRPSPVPADLRKELFDPLPPGGPVILRAPGSAPACVLAPVEARLPGHYRALTLVADPAKHVVQAVATDADGSTFLLDKVSDLLAGGEDFRPVGRAVGPDGTLYVLDGRPQGRLFRLTWAGLDPDDALPRRPLDSWAKLLKGSDDDLLAALATPEASDRRLAGDELARRGAKSLPGLLKVYNDAEQPYLARTAALSAALGLWDDAVRKIHLDLLGSAGRDLRRTAAHVLGLYADVSDEAAHAALLRALNNGDNASRRAIAVAMGRLRGDGAADALVAAVVFDEGRDPAFRQGLDHAVELLGKPGIDRLLSVADTGVDADIGKIVQTFATLTTPEAAAALPRLLLNPHLTARQRALLLRTYPRYRFAPPLSLDAIPAHFEAMPDEPAEVKLAALEALAVSDAPAGAKLLAFVAPLVKDREPAVRVPALRTLAALDLPAAKKAVANLPAEAREKLLAELKKHPDAAPLLRELEK